MSWQRQQKAADDGKVAADVSTAVLELAIRASMRSRIRTAWIYSGLDIQRLGYTAAWIYSGLDIQRLGAGFKLECRLLKANDISKRKSV